jgi:cytochrome c biogenesis protein CcmG/thiol:disulfide interchange protein DsbE
VAVVRRRLIICLAVLAAIGALVGLELVGSSSSERVGRRAPRLPTGVLVPPAATLASLRGEPAAINFWASWCEPCREEAPALERLARSLGNGARIVGVNWDDGNSEARAWIEKYGWTFPNLRDGEGTVGRDYGLRGLPATFIVDAHGRIADVLLGPQSESSLREALDSAG